MKTQIAIGVTLTIISTLVLSQIFMGSKEINDTLINRINNSPNIGWKAG